MFTLTIHTDNDSFTGDPTTEIARILREVADRLQNGEVVANLRDINGSHVGAYGLS